MKENEFKINQNIGWKWMGRVISGIVEEVYYRPIEKEIKGKMIKRNGSSEKPAYLVKSSAGNYALKLQTEIFILEVNPLDKKLDF
jgi:hypothetical protein